MPQVQLAGGLVSGVVNGNYGNYAPASDGTYTVDTRDAPSLIAAGMAYMRQEFNTYSTAIAVLTATVGYIVASAALSAGTLAIAHQPDVMRPGKVVINAGTTATTAGSVALSYTGNDGVATVDTFSAVCVASSGLTYFTSKGMAHIASAIIGTITGGTSPGISIDTDAEISLPVAPGAVDFAVKKETIDTGNETVGTVSTTILGTIAPTTVPNSTHTYSFAYAYNSPVN